MKSKDFAKIFYSECGQQILVTKEDDSDGDPALKFSTLIGCGGIGICSMYMSFEENEEARDKSFDLIDQNRAQTVFDVMMDSTGELIG